MDKCIAPPEGWWCTGPVCLVGHSQVHVAERALSRRQLHIHWILSIPALARCIHLRIGRQENNDSAKSSLWLWSWKAQAFVPLFMMGLNPWMGILDQIITYHVTKNGWRMVFFYSLCLCTPSHNKVGNGPSSFHVPTLNTKYTTNDKSQIKLASTSMSRAIIFVRVFKIITLFYCHQLLWDIHTASPRSCAYFLWCMCCIIKAQQKQHQIHTLSL